MKNRENSVKLAIIGAGSMAEEHVRAFAAMDGVEVVGIYSRTYSKAITLAKKYGINSVCNSISELYNITNSDAVIIAVSETSTKDICYEAFKFQWVALVEKPLGHNLEEAIDITEEAKKTNSKVFVAEIYLCKEYFVTLGPLTCTIVLSGIFLSVSNSCTLLTL